MEKQYIFFDTPAGCRAGVVASICFAIVVVFAVFAVRKPLWLDAVIVVALAAAAASVAAAADRRALRRARQRGAPPGR